MNKTSIDVSLNKDNMKLTSSEEESELIIHEEEKEKLLKICFRDLLKYAFGRKCNLVGSKADKIEQICDKNTKIIDKAQYL